MNTQTRSHNANLRHQLKSNAVNTQAIDAVLIDGQKRYITPGVFMLQTRAEITPAGVQHRHFALHTKRGQISPSLVSFVKWELYERGWKYQPPAIEAKGVWEGVFERK